MEEQTTDKTINHKIECMLFVAGDPVAITELARVLDLPPAQAATPHQALAQWTDAWRRRWAD